MTITEPNISSPKSGEPIFWSVNQINVPSVGGTPKQREKHIAFLRARKEYVKGLPGGKWPLLTDRAGWLAMAAHLEAQGFDVNLEGVLGGYA
jgi:hypothetical protein